MGRRARHARLASTFVGLFQLGLALPALLFGADGAAESLHAVGLLGLAFPWLLARATTTAPTAPTASIARLRLRAA